MRVDMQVDEILHNVFSFTAVKVVSRGVTEKKNSVELSTWIVYFTVKNYKTLALRCIVSCFFINFTI